MDESILRNTKKILGLDPAYTPFDLDIILFINSAFSVLTQLGVGPTDGFMIEDDEAQWSDITYLDPVSLASASLPDKQLNMVKTYIYLATRRLFDPASTRFVIDAINKQIEEYEWRLKQFMDELKPEVKKQPEREYIEVFSGLPVSDGLEVTIE